MTNIARPQRIATGFWIAGALSSIGVALFSYRYLASVGPLAPTIIANAFARPWLSLHVAGAATALLLVAVQFLPRVRATMPAVHRRIGRIYVASCLVGAVSGIALAFGSTAGPIATMGFGGLGIAWLVANLAGWQTARQRRFDRHRIWMIRSFALTFAAVTLRIYLGLRPLLGVDFLDGYRAISFLCWVPNLIVAEIVIHRTRRVGEPAGQEGSTKTAQASSGPAAVTIAL